MIGAYFPCFGQLTSANEIMSAFRRYYPTSTLVMINDAGDKRHEILAEKYQCSYFYESENIGYPGGRQDYEQIIRWVRRFLHYIQYIKEEWFVLLEDDVLIMKAVDESTLLFDINGINPANLLPYPSVQLIKDRGYHLDKNRLMYGAMGGAIFRTSFFKSLNLETVVKDLTAFGEKCPQQLTGQNWYYSDVVLSFLAYINGGSLGQYPEFAELWFQDLGSRLEQNRIATLNQFKFLYNYPVHPHLFELNSSKYTIVLPTRGHGEAFEIFMEQALPRYVKYLNWDQIDQFIIICPAEHQKNLLLPSLPFTIVTDEELYNENIDGWIRQQINKLVINERIRTEHYLILDDDLILTRPLAYSDFFDETGRIYYSYESWPISSIPLPGQTHFATSPGWWASSCRLHQVNYQPLTHMKNLMGVTPQLMITRVVHQMLHSLGKDWIKNMIQLRATEYATYWIYLLKTLRSHYYTPRNNLFAMDNTCNILLQNLSQEDVKSKIQTGLTQSVYFFIVIQSWIKYPKSWIDAGFI